MRLAILSDIHGNLPALEAVLADIDRRGVDGIVNLGDILSGPLWPAETADRLMPLAWPTLAGNHERQLLAVHERLLQEASTSAQARAEAPLRRQPLWDRHSDVLAARSVSAAHRAWLSGLQPTRWLAPDLFACHGTPRSDVEYFLETVTLDYGVAGSRGVRAATPDEALERAGDFRATLVLCGHTHHPRRVELPDGRLVVNPGSVGLPAFDDEQPWRHDMETGTPQARYAVVTRDHAGRWEADLRAVDYDYEAAAARAEASGRGDWADALRTGRVGRREHDVR